MRTRKEVGAGHVLFVIVCIVAFGGHQSEGGANDIETAAKSKLVKLQRLLEGKEKPAVVQEFLDFVLQGGKLTCYTSENFAPNSSLPLKSSSLPSSFAPLPPLLTSRIPPALRYIRWQGRNALPSLFAGEDRLIVPLSLESPDKTVLTVLHLGAVPALTDLVRPHADTSCTQHPRICYE